MKQNIVPRNANGQLHGLCIGYFDDGNVYGRQRYANGIPHGICEWYWGNGKIGYKDYRIKGKDIYTELYTGSNRIIFKI